MIVFHVKHIIIKNMSVFHVKHKIGLLLYSKTILSYVCLLTKFLCVRVSYPFILYIC